MTTTTPDVQPGTALRAADAIAQARLDDHVADLRREADRFRKNAERRLVNRAAAIAEASGRYSTADVLSWVRRAVEMGAAIPNLGPETVEDVFRLTRVPNAALRDRFLRLQGLGEMNSNALAERAKFRRPDGMPDAALVERLLGLVVTEGGEGRNASLRLFVTYDQAVALAKGLDLDPHLAGV
jgi:hypothetical protein